MNPFATEPKGSLAPIAALLPSRNGRRTSRTTVLRWVKQGVRGSRLEAIRVGNHWLTSYEALQRFLDRLSH